MPYLFRVAYASAMSNLHNQLRISLFKPSANELPKSIILKSFS